MLTPSTIVERNGQQFIERKQTSEPPWKHYARGMLPLSPVAKKFEGTKILDAFTSRGEIDCSPGERSFDQEDNNSRNAANGGESRDSMPPCKQTSRNAMLKRLADCFTYNQRVVKSGTRRHSRVLGFHPRLYTIHENASELENDLDATYHDIITTSDPMERKSLANTAHHYPIRTDDSFDYGEISCCQTNDQKLAALHEDIKDLWKRLENVEREFAWARGSLVMRHTDIKH